MNSMADTDTQVVRNWLSEAERVKGAVPGFRWPDEMSFAEAVMDALAAAAAAAEAGGAAAEREGVAEAVKARGFYAVLAELQALAEGEGYGELRYWIKCAADAAKNSEYAARARSHNGSEGA